MQENYRIVEIREAKADIVAKWASRALQLLGVTFAGLSIWILLVIQEEVNQINARTRQVDRALNLVGHLDDDQDDLLIDELFFDTEQFVGKYHDRAKMDITVLVHAFLQKRLHENDAELLRNALFEHLETLRSIYVCLSSKEKFCDQNTIMTSIGEKFISYYIYLKPVFYCDSVFARNHYGDSLEFLASEFALWSDDYVLVGEEESSVAEEQERHAVKLINVTGNYECDIVNQNIKIIEATQELLGVLSLPSGVDPNEKMNEDSIQENHGNGMTQ